MDPFGYLCFVCVCHIVVSAFLRSLVITCWERADLFARLYVMYSFVFITFPYGVLGQVRSLIVLIPVRCLLPYIVKLLWKKECEGNNNNSNNNNNNNKNNRITNLTAELTLYTLTQIIHVNLQTIFYICTCTPAYLYILGFSHQRLVSYVLLSLFCPCTDCQRSGFNGFTDRQIYKTCTTMIQLHLVG